MQIEKQINLLSFRSEYIKECLYRLVGGPVRSSMISLYYYYQLSHNLNSRSQGIITHSRFFTDLIIFESLYYKT